MITLTLPWPPSSLSPNARQHWRAHAKAKASYRTACAYHARMQGAKQIEAQRMAVRLRFVPPDRRRRDLDNLIASMKSGLDGLADVLGVDDSRWQLAAELVDGQIGGFVRVEVVGG
jgi:crossover junction endodeoxyribonuclease RusA